MTAGELAELLSINHKTVYKWAARERIPSYRMGRAVRFDPKMLAEWLRTRIRKPIVKSERLSLAG
jgi:excisionase family DNA binding protein